MSKSVKYNNFFKIGFSSAILGTVCNIIPVSASNIDINCSEKKINSYLSSSNSYNNFEKQNEILHKIENLATEKNGYIKNYNELKTLTLNNICVDSNSLTELENVKDLTDLYSKNLTVDIFDENNLDNCLKNILKVILSNNIENTSFSSNFDKINNNKDIKKELVNLQDYLNITNETCNDKQVFILKKLNEIEFLLNINSIKENSINTFFNAMKKVYQVLISIRVSKILVDGEREKAIDYLQRASKSRTSSTAGKLGYEGATVGITTTLHQDEGKSEKSFYEVGIGGGLNLSLGYELGIGIEDLKAVLGAYSEFSTDISTSTVFFSLEQFLDAQVNPNLKDKSSSYLTSKTINKLILDRKNLIETEKNLLSSFQTSIEFYLKAANIIPTSVNMTWPKLTKASTPSNVSKKTFSGNIKSIAEILNSSLGSTTTISGKKIDQKINNSFLKLINQDCSTNLGLSPDEIIKELAPKHSIYFKLKKDFEKLLIEDAHKEKNQKVLSILFSQILADVRQYNSVLSILANKNIDDNSKNKAKEIKHEIEKRWIGKRGIIKTKSREKFLKTAIALSTYLRQFADNDEEIALFKQMYNELTHLLEMQSFSKNSKSPYDGFKTKKSYKEYSISGNNSINVFDIATASINVKYVKTDNEPGYGDGNDIIISMNIPFVDTLLTGVEFVKNALKKMNTNTPKNDFNIEEAFITTAKILDNVVGFTGVPVALKLPGVSATANGYLNLIFELTKINKTNNFDSIVPIDNQEKTNNNKNSWILKCIKAANVSNLNANLSGNVNTGTINVSGKTSVNDQYTKGIKFKLGDKCLAFPISRFNVASICSKDTNDIPIKNYIWKSFKSSNKNDLLKMFVNISNTKSIAYYQVQSIYNEIISELKKSDEKNIENICKETFKKFIESCQKLNKLDEKSYYETLSLFEEILGLNYNYNFCKKLNRNWNLDFKNQKIIINY